MENAIVDISKEPISFRNRWFSRVKFIVFFFSFLILGPLILGIVSGELSSALCVSVFFSFGLLINVILTQRFFIYFITRARLTETTLTLAYLHKDRPIEQTIPLENLVITLGRRREKNGRRPRNGHPEVIQLTEQERRMRLPMPVRAAMRES